MGSRVRKAEPGDTVVLIELPPGLIRGLPRTDQKAISEIVGKPILLLRYDRIGRVEVEFTDRSGAIHSVFVSPNFIERARNPLGVK